MVEQPSLKTQNHYEVKSEDGSFTAFSKQYNEHYHSTKDGALFESLYKHIIPAINQTSTDSIKILDICFGLGFNTLATIFYIKEEKLDKKIHIISPELDKELVQNLTNFKYPKEFDDLLHVVRDIAKNGFYEDEKIKIELFYEDARNVIKRYNNFFDIIYQDAFSPSSNPALWTLEYFKDITDAMSKNAILTTYSIALKTRLALYQNGLNIYLNSGKNFRSATVASKRELALKKVNMEHKISCNVGVEPLRD
ncbi:MAG: MnmC family methyltransferase [Campylobacterota bacterium]|nr:MnmC family methyltransferase [Campylobacterota bacterium]